ncbi:helix-turn-helix domain-containing protein, partial [Dyella jejuensis]
MNSHKHARLTLQGRKRLMIRIAAHGVRTARKWLARYRDEGQAGLVDRSSRPRRLRASLTIDQRAKACALRSERQTIREVAGHVTAAVSTVRRWLASQGMNRLPPLQPPMPIRRYEHDAPGDLLHLDIKKLGR